MKISNMEMWNKLQKANQTVYGQNTLTFAQRWANCMEFSFEIDNRSIQDSAMSCAQVAGKNQISSNQFDLAFDTLISCWEYGDQLKEWVGE